MDADRTNHQVIVEDLYLFRRRELRRRLTPHSERLRGLSVGAKIAGGEVATI